MAEVEKFLFNRREAALSLGIRFAASTTRLPVASETRRIGKKVLVTRQSDGCSRAVTTLTRSARHTAPDFDEATSQDYALPKGESTDGTQTSKAA